MLDQRMRAPWESQVHSQKHPFWARIIGAFIIDAAGVIPEEDHRQDKAAALRPLPYFIQKPFSKATSPDLAVHLFFLLSL